MAPNNWQRGQTGSPLPGPCPWWSLLSRTWAGGRAGGALLLSLAPRCQTHGDPPEPAFCLPSQLLKIAFDDEVAMESAEVFRKHLHKLRYPQHVHGTFAFTVGQSPKQAMQPKAKEKNPSLRYLQRPRSRGSGRGMLQALAGGAGALLCLLQPTGRATRHRVQSWSSGSLGMPCSDLPGTGSLLPLGFCKEGNGHFFWGPFPSRGPAKPGKCADGFSAVPCTAAQAEAAQVPRKHLVGEAPLGTRAWALPF